MSSLRESVFYSINHGDLTPNANEETGCDRIGALARADPLGAALWRIIGSHDVHAFRDAIKLLADRMTDDNPLTLKVARRVIEEWMACLCERCEGRKFVISPENGVRSVCPVCKGSGHGRSSDNDRIRALHLSRRDYSKMTGLFDLGHTLLNRADIRAGRQVAYQLERNRKKK